MTTRSRRLATGLVVVAALIALRLALPTIVVDVVNTRLAALPGYDGSIGDVDIALWRGAYRITNIRITRESVPPEELPFFEAPVITAEIDGAQLLRGVIVGDMVIERPVLRAIQADEPEAEQLGRGVNWPKSVRTLFPVRLDRVEIRDGAATLRAPGIATRDALYVEDLDAVINNLTNAAESEAESFATYVMTGKVLADAPLRIEGSLNPATASPTFDIDLTLRDVPLVRLNPWLRAYAGIDAEAGWFDLAMEIAARDGTFRGYVKPLLRDIDIYRSEEAEASPLRRLWEGIVEVVAEVLENEDKEQVATRMPLSGTLEDPETSLLEAFVGVMRNAFVGAFSRSLEDSISLGSTRGESK